MYTLRIENQKGEKITLTDDSKYRITDITGLGPPPATINTAIVAMNDGSVYNSSRVNERNIVLTIAFVNDVENGRIGLYEYFKTKQKCKIYYKNSKRDVYIEGYVETFEPNIFSMSASAQISIICPKPYFKDLYEMYVDISKIISMFEFPFAIEEEGIELSIVEKTLISSVINNGDVSTGVIIELRSSGRVLNPRIYNTDTREMLGLYFDMASGDLITINTYTGEKGIKLTKNGITTNIINTMIEDSVWFQLTPGDNVFTFSCDEGEEFLDMRLIHIDLYEGV